MWKWLGICTLWFCTVGYADPIRVVAAENFYGQIAAQLGGPYVQVTSILQNPQQDPHLFSSSPATAKAIADANIIVYNGIDYDPWIKNLIAASHSQTQSIIVVADLIGKTAGDNPHIWYHPKTMLVYADYLTAQLKQLDPLHQLYYNQQLETFKKSYQDLLKKIQQLHQQYQGTPIIATEPVFNDMAEALGLKIYGQGFQRSIMNNTEPSVSDTKNFEDLLKKHQVKVFIYNDQVSNPTTMRMQKLAQKAGIPTIGVSEIAPAGVDYFTWMHNELDDLAKNLQQNKP